MKKIGIVFLSVLLCACSSYSKKHLDHQVHLLFFYIETCSECHAFQENVIPLLKGTFDDQIEIKQYNLDDEDIADVYDPVIDSLVDFDEEFYGNGPFIVLDGYFALLGYTEGDEDYLIDDIQHAVNGGDLSYELEGRRFLYRSAS